MDLRVERRARVSGFREEGGGGQRGRNCTRVVLQAGGKAWLLRRGLLRGNDGDDGEEPGVARSS